MTIVIRSIFQEDGKYYLQIFLDECLYDLQVLEYDRIDISEGIDANKSSASKECCICHYWYFKDIDNDCHGLMQMQKAINFNIMLLLFLLKEVIIEFIFDI